MTVSVLIACWNAANTLAETLNSVLAQTRPADEIIVVDDGSIDETASVAAKFADHGVKLIRQENRGASAARNRAFLASTGRYVIFLDADDLIGSRHLKALEARIGTAGRSVAMSRWDRFFVSPDEARFPHRPTEVDLPGCDWLIRSWTGARPMMQSGMFLIPRILIEQFGGWDERLTLIDDFEFFARILASCDEVRFASDAHLFYRSGSQSSLSARKGRSSVESQFLSLELGTGHLLAMRNDAMARRACADMFQDFDYAHYPDHPDLRARAREHVFVLGGSTLQPDGPPRFQTLRRFLGWRLARRVQRFAETRGLNRAGLKAASL